jgi:hypothetical protein
VEGETRVVSLLDLRREMAGGSMTVEEPAVEEEPDMMMELDEEVIRMTDTAERPAFRPGLRPGMPGFPSPKDRPVPLQRREPSVRESFSASPEEFSATIESPSRESPSRAPEPENPVSASTATPAPPAKTPEDAAGEASETPRSPRRRRGRRGGRRGRGRGESGAVPPNGTDAASSSAGVEPDGGDESDDGDEA